MPFAGVGVDIEQIARVERILARHPNFVLRVFSEGERLYCETQSRPAAHYAARLAARVAVAKALGCDAEHPVGRHDIGVDVDDKGRVRCVLAGRAKELADQQNVQIVELSLSFNRESATANAVAVTPESRPKVDKQKDAKKELAAQFRKARDIIRELDAAASAAEETKSQSS